MDGQNPRISKKERNLIKGAIRRVFSRSELRKQALEATVVNNYRDLTRPRVKTWCRCPECNGHFAKSEMEVDHVDPIIPVDSSLEDMTWDQVIDRVFCDTANLRAVCGPCHDTKTKAETKARAAHRKAKKQLLDGSSPGVNSRKRN